jgi:polyphenol oxidase
VPHFFGGAQLYELFDNEFREDAAELAYVAPEGDDLADQAAAGEGILVAGHDKDGFDTTDGAIGQGELEFIAEVGDVADAAEDNGCLGAFDEIDGEAGKFFDANAGEIAQEGADHGDALGEGEELGFFGVDADGDDQFIEEANAAADDVKVPIGDGIELARENGDARGGAGHGEQMIRDGGGGWEECRLPIVKCRMGKASISFGIWHSAFGISILGFMLEVRIGNSGVRYYCSVKLEAIGVRHAFSTRVGGISPAPFDSLNLGNPNGCEVQDDYDRIWKNYARLSSSIDCPGEPPLRVHQVHGAEVASVSAGRDFDTSCKADAIVSEDSERVISVRTADCVPLLFSSGDGTIVAAVHAGWRGIVAGVIPAAIGRMVNRGCAQGSIVAAIGPCIGRNAFEVGDEVAEEFRRAFAESAVVGMSLEGKAVIDLRLTARLQLLAAGVAEENIDTTDRCTVTHREEFYSHRRDRGVTGRMAAIIAPGRS